jgi:membrane protease YdiL (CAAX protease family)
MSGLMMFPMMLLGHSIAGFVMTGAIRGKEGLRDLLARMFRIGSRRWLATLLLPTALVLGVLFALKILASPIFSPNHFPVGFAFGCAAGFFEEIGWTGFAFPAMRSSQSAIGAAISLGLLWGLWHAPVIDYLGSATPHGNYWLPFFLAFTAANDGDESVDLLDLLQHREPASGPVGPRKLDGGHVLSGGCHCG